MSDETLQQLKRAVRALDKMQARLDAVERDQTEPIAVLGLGCRFPGAAGLDAFWELLTEGRDGTGPVPADREELHLCFDPDVDAPGKTALARGGFLEGLDRFDHNFFKVSPKEAAAMDPQQRLLLEVAWEALEQACIPPDRLFGSNTGVYIGACSFDFALWRALRTARERIDAYFATGTALSVNAGRLSYFLGLVGPSMTLDTACSSSLVAVHQACAALRGGECELALAGGVSLLLAPEYSINFTKANMLAADGRCKTFDARADGFARAEGCGMIVLKRLGRARADGDRIRAVILGSAVNQDGASGGLTVPSGPSQEAVIRKALKAARLEPRQIDYVEAHGTGTPLGDPIEIRALNEVFAVRDRPLSVGSVKTNIGHCEAAAGIAGLIKSVLAIESGLLPAHLHLQRSNPHLELDRLPIRIPTETGDWPAIPGQPRRAGVSAFGFSGTNSHVILEQAPAGAPDTGSRAAPVFTLSANDSPALRSLAGAYADWLTTRPDLALSDLCAAALRGRTHLPVRLAMVSGDVAGLARNLKLFAETGQAPHLVEGDLNGRPRVAFLFAGQGAQYPGMGALFYRNFPAFRRALDCCDALAGPRLGRSLVDVLCADLSEAFLQQTEVAQPALFAFEYALSQLWLDHGIQPDVILGHSVGEFAAATAAGLFSMEDGLGLVIERARLIAQLREPGGMVLIGADEPAVAERLRSWPDLAIAAINGPRSTVISGPHPQLDQAAAGFRDQGFSIRPLAASHAFHAPLLQAIAPAWLEVLRRVDFRRPGIPMIPCLTGRPDQGEAMSTPDYWLAQTLGPVRFAEGIQTLLSQDTTVCLEIGPGSDLSTIGRQLDSRGCALWLPSLHRQETEPRRFYRAVAQLHVLGRSIRQEALAPDPWPRLSLPTYRFQRTRHWLPTEPLPSRAGLPGGQPDAHRPSFPPAQPQPDAGLVHRLEQTHPHHHRLILSQWLIQELADIVEADDPAAIDPRRGFAELGIDSLMATRILDRVRDALNLELPVTTMFNYPTVPELAEHLLQRWRKGPEVPAAVAARPAPEDNPGEDEIAALIAARFASTHTEEFDGRRL